MADRPTSRKTQLSQPTTVALGSLSLQHFNFLRQAMWRILSTDLATETFSQVVDGRPTRDVYRDYLNEFRRSFHNNLRPSDAALEAVKSCRRDLNLGVLQINANVAQAYQNSSIGSREFHLRLIEMLAILCHGVAVHLYIAYEGGFHKPEAPEPVSAELREMLGPRVRFPTREAPPAELFHPSYEVWEQYPHGIADIVGYWTEFRLFGGVVLFDRGDTGFECRDIFIHPVGRYMIFKVSDSQMQAYISFLQFGEEPPEGIRFRAEEYAPRIDPYDAMSLNIYRDRYERVIPETRPVHCIVRGEDIPGYKQALANLREQTWRD